MRCHGRLLALAVLAVLCACSGGGSTTPATTILQANSTINAPPGNVQSVQLGLQPTIATLPVVAQITVTLLFPAVRTPATISLSGSATAPAGIVLESLRRAQSGTLTVYDYVTIVSPITVSLPSLPAMTLHFPALTPLAGKSVYYGISDLNAQGGLVSFNTQGPGTIDGQTVSFAQVPTPMTFEAGHKYTFVVYATGTAPVKVGATKIYVASAASLMDSSVTVTTYKLDGTQTAPTIKAGSGDSRSGFSSPAVAVDAAGKIYVANDHTGIVTTYKADGTPTKPTITAGYGCSGLTVDAAGKIYVSNFRNNSVTTYNADGTPATPTITAGLSYPASVAVDAAGKIYVANQGSNVTTYNADGTRTTPTITLGPSTYGNVGGPTVAVDAAGKIYVTNVDNFTVTTYEADGTPATPTIISGLSLPTGIAVDGAGKIYVSNVGDNTVTTYNADGTPTTPIITAGLNNPGSIVVH